MCGPHILFSEWLMFQVVGACTLLSILPSMVTQHAKYPKTIYKVYFTYAGEYVDIG